MKRKRRVKIVGHAVLRYDSLADACIRKTKRVLTATAHLCLLLIILHGEVILTVVIRLEKSRCFEYNDGICRAARSLGQTPIHLSPASITCLLRRPHSAPPSLPLLAHLASHASSLYLHNSTSDAKPLHCFANTPKSYRRVPPYSRIHTSLYNCVSAQCTLSGIDDSCSRLCEGVVKPSL